MEEKYYLGVTVKCSGDDLRDTALRRAVELAPFSVPESSVEQEYRLLLAEFRHRLTYDSMATGKPLYQYEGLEEELEGLKAEAVFNVKAQLVLRDIIRREGLTVSDAELEAEGKAIASRQGVSLEEVKGLLGESLSMIGTELLERKAIEFIVKHAVLS